LVGRVVGNDLWWLVVVGSSRQRWYWLFPQLSWLSVSHLGNRVTKEPKHDAPHRLAVDLDDGGEGAAAAAAAAAVVLVVVVVVTSASVFVLVSVLLLVVVVVVVVTAAATAAAADGGGDPVDR
jgi:hypothetical protein